MQERPGQRNRPDGRSSHRTSPDPSTPPFDYQGLHAPRVTGCLPFLLSDDHFATMLARLNPRSSELGVSTQVQLPVRVEQNQVKARSSLWRTPKWPKLKSPGLTRPRPPRTPAPTSSTSARATARTRTSRRTAASRSPP